MKSLYVFVLIATLMCQHCATTKSVTKQNVPAKDFVLTTFDGNQVRLSDFRGKVVLLDFWASWCEPCKKSMPYYSELYNRLKDRGFEIVAVNVEPDKTKAVEYVKEWGLGFTVLWDKDGVVANIYNPEKMPTAYLIDKNGVIRRVLAGFSEDEKPELERMINTLLSE